jgi:hypothetical protein
VKLLACLLLAWRWPARDVPNEIEGALTIGDNLKLNARINEKSRQVAAL